MLERSCQATLDLIILSPERQPVRGVHTVQWLSFMAPILISYLLQLGRGQFYRLCQAALTAGMVDTAQSFNTVNTTIIQII